MSAFARSWSVLWPPTLIVVVCLVVWQCAVWIFDIPEYLLPSPIQVFSALIFEGERLGFATGRTAGSMLAGFGLSALFGIVMGSLLATVPLARRGVYPLTLLLQMVPLVAIAPMLVIWFG